jgi:hypothetical protein
MMPSPRKFAGALGRIIRAAATGQRLFVESGVTNARMAQCLARDGKCFDRRVYQCQVCSCSVTLKATLATEECPMGHWKKEYIRTVS